MRSLRIPVGLLAGFLWLVGAGTYAQVIIADNFNVPGNGTGFNLNAGVNSGINPPATRLTGSAAANLRYVLTTTTKTNTAFSLSGSKLKVTSATGAGRFSLSASGSTAFDFGPALGIPAATRQQPVVYDLAIKMANSSSGTQRFSFALAAAEGDATTWDFGVQVYRAASTDNFYTIGKRIDTAASGLASDLNASITNTLPGTYGTELSLLVRVTDAGAETTTFSSRVQVSLDGGSTWIYDTRSDPSLTQGWRLDGPGRYILWDVAPDAGPVTYDDFSMVPVPVAATLIAPQGNTPNLGASPVLTAAVSNRAPANVTVTFYGREAATAFPGRDFAIVVLPDTQNYAREASGNGPAWKEEWFAQTEWIITNRVTRNIAYVSQLGDIVQNGDIKNGSPNDTEWRNATNAMYRLENPTRTLLPEGIPYGLAVGNHDEEPIGDPTGTTTHYNRYFGISHFAGKSYYGGHYGSDNNNHFDLFSASGVDFIVLYFEFGSYGSGLLDWANAVLATNQNRRAIAVTHYVANDTSPYNFSAQGSAIYQALKGNTNFFLMLGGHVFNSGGESSRTDTYQSRTVRTFVSDYQGYTNGGAGYMRVMYFSPSNNVVNIKSYSPWLNKYLTDANSQMSFPYDLQSTGGSGSASEPYPVLGTFSNVPPGSVVSCPFPGLQSTTDYEWYVRVTDAAGNSFISPTGRFTTANNSPPAVSNLVLTVNGDEPSRLALPASDSNGDALTVWTVTPPLHGMTTDLDPVGGTLTFVPARGFHGLDRFTFQANDGLADSAVGTVVLNVLAPADANTNGLPDAWEAAYGITNPDADADNDGQSNLAEYLAGTNPTNAASIFQLLSAAMQPDGTFALTWASVGGTRYRVQYSDGDANGGFTGVFTDIVQEAPSEIDPGPYGTPSTQTFFDNFTLTPSLTGSARYYRVQVLQ